MCGLSSCPARSRPYPPGQHGRRRRRSESEYHLRLLEKQKLRAHYGVRERQFRRLFAEAQRMPGPTGENFLVLLERRLDSLVRRLGFARSIHQARQLVSHGHVRVDGERVDRPSYQVRPGQVIALDPELAVARHAALTTGDIPPYLERDAERLVGRLTRLPARHEIPYPMPVDERLLVEFYAA